MVGGVPTTKMLWWSSLAARGLATNVRHGAFGLSAILSAWRAALCMKGVSLDVIFFYLAGGWVEAQAVVVVERPSMS